MGTMRAMRILFLAFIAIATMPLAQARGGPLGIDHRIGFDGVWKRSNQDLVQSRTLVTIVGGHCGRAARRA